MSPEITSESQEQIHSFTDYQQWLGEKLVLRLEISKGTDQSDLDSLDLEIEFFKVKYRDCTEQLTQYRMMDSDN